MPDLPPPRRRRLQMHLSTAVWMMVAAGGIIWGNLCQSEVSKEQVAWKSKFVVDAKPYGWPLAVTARIVRIRLQPQNTEIHFEPKGGVLYIQAAADALVALAILFAVWYVSEWWILRRKTKS